MTNKYKWYTPDKLCKYIAENTKECFNDDPNPDKCKNCSKNPHRFDDRPITKGQIIFLTSKGYTEEEISSWSFNKAGEEIRRYKI